MNPGAKGCDSRTNALQSVACKNPQGRRKDKYRRGRPTCRKPAETINRVACSVAVAPAPSSCRLSDGRSLGSQATEDWLFSSHPCAVSAARSPTRLFEIRLEIWAGDVCCPEISVRIDIQNNYRLEPIPRIAQSGPVLYQTAFSRHGRPCCGSVQLVAAVVEVLRVTLSSAPVRPCKQSHAAQIAKIFSRTRREWLRLPCRYVRGNVRSRLSLGPYQFRLPGEDWLGLMTLGGGPDWCQDLHRREIALSRGATDLLTAVTV